MRTKVDDSDRQMPASLRLNGSGGLKDPHEAVRVQSFPGFGAVVNFHLAASILFYWEGHACRRSHSTPRSAAIRGKSQKKCLSRTVEKKKKKHKSRTQTGFHQHLKSKTKRAFSRFVLGFRRARRSTSFFSVLQARFVSFFLRLAVERRSTSLFFVLQACFVSFFSRLTLVSGARELPPTAARPN